MLAIISDIHSNLEALEAVLKDIEKQGISDIICLGDIVGYGPNPEECIDLISSRCRFCLSGNHDYAVLTDTANFNPIAATAINYTRDVLRNGIEKDLKKQRRWNYLQQLPETHEEGEFFFVHGSPRAPRYEYILPTDVMFGMRDKILDLFRMIRRYCFVGHSHVPGVIDSDMRFLTPAMINGRYRLSRSKAIINVGSVGQPRDGDNRSCYVIVTDDEVIYRRVSYDFRKTMKKIRAIPSIDDFIAQRLAFGM